MLKEGGMVVFPTETAYGLGVDATNERAVERLMAVKGREGWKTPPLIAADRQMVERFVVLSPVLERLADQFWPGALTIVAPAKQGLVRGVVREGTVAIRVSSHPVARALSRELGAPIVATSANVAGKPTCYDVESVKRQFTSHLLQPDYYLDVEPLEHHRPSTIVAEQDDHLIVLRQGEIEIPPSYVA